MVRKLHSVSFARLIFHLTSGTLQFVTYRKLMDFYLDSTYDALACALLSCPVGC